MIVTATTPSIHTVLPLCPVVRQAHILMQRRYREHARQHMRRRPGKYRRDIDGIELRRVDPERARGDRHESADRRHEAARRTPPACPKRWKKASLCAITARISDSGHAPSSSSLPSDARPRMRRAVAEHGARPRRPPAPPTASRSPAGNQGAQRQNDGGAWDECSEHRHGFQQGSEKKREIAQPRHARRQNGIRDRGRTSRNLLIQSGRGCRS